MIKKIILSLLSFIFLLYANSPFASADEYVISGNGSGSDNQISATTSTETTVTQTNEANVENNVDVNANTGENEVNSNTGGDTAISTGDINASSTVENNLNTSSINDLECCKQATEVKISGNGAGSENSVNLTQGGGTNITVSNTANITNNVTGYANTGYNKANGNLGSVSITTGNIYASDTIKNTGINIYSIKASAGFIGSVSIMISDNGAYSQNSIVFADNSSTNVNIYNSASIVNNSKWDLNTGKNEAKYNLGDVVIATGDIYFDSYIENGPINSGLVDIDCCERDDDGDGDGVTPPDGSVPPPSGNGGGNGGGGNGGDGRSDGKGGNGAILGAMLPATGTMWIYLITLAGLMMFFMGWYLRRSSGNSPPAYAIA